MSEDIQQRIERLRQLIRHHGYLYYVLDAPEVSDAEYDALMNKLRELEGAHPELITPDSPTQRVGGQVQEQFSKVRHPAPILSLGNAFNSDEVRSWHERLLRLLPSGTPLQFVVEPKIDHHAQLAHDTVRAPAHPCTCTWPVCSTALGGAWRSLHAHR